jgi:hypothetical protein
MADSATPDASMVNPIEPIIEETNNSITVIPHDTATEMERLFSQVINLSKDNILHEPTCLICSSPHRTELEQTWISNKSVADVQQVYKGKTGKNISSEVVENHMTQHLTKGVREIQKIEYVDRIKRLHSHSLSTLDRISMCYAILIERLMGINSITTNGEESIAEIEKIKSSETSRLMGVFNNILKLQASILGEMKKEGEVITLPSDQFIKVFNNALLAAKTDREKQIVKNILDELAGISKKSQ